MTSIRCSFQAVSSVMSLDISVRRYSVRALGLLGVYDKHLMMENLELINKVRSIRFFY